MSTDKYDRQVRYIYQNNNNKIDYGEKGKF